MAANGFDDVYYLQHKRDVTAAGVDPLGHFQTFGWKEGRDPNALFDTVGYLAGPCGRAGGRRQPLDHCHWFGWKEDRDPSVGFAITDYLLSTPTSPPNSTRCTITCSSASTRGVPHSSTEPGAKLGRSIGNRAVDHFAIRAICR
jgi:hypothetical protein